MPIPACSPTQATCATCQHETLTTAALIVSLVVTVCVAWLFTDALHSKRGLRWVSTMVGGILFGEIVEALNIHDLPVIASSHIYCYPNLPINVYGVPFWVPVGWGGIIYAATWTAQRLRLPPLGRAASAAFLAASIDFSLDPVSQLMGFWNWKQYTVDFIRVPYDNFIGWYLIVFIYSLTTAWVLRRLKSRWDIPATRYSPPWWRSVAIELFAPIACAALSALILVAFKLALNKLTPYSSDDNGHSAATIFIVATALGAGVTLFLGRKPIADEEPAVNWPVMIVPVVIHLTCYGIFLAYADWNEPMLVATIPLQLLVGLFIFSTPWRRKLSLIAPASAAN